MIWKSKAEHDQRTWWRGELLTLYNYTVGTVGGMRGIYYLISDLLSITDDRSIGKFLSTECNGTSVCASYMD